MLLYERTTGASFCLSGNTSYVCRACSVAVRVCDLPINWPRIKETVFHILFITNNAYLPQLIGGAEWSVHHFVMGLREQGHEVGVLCQLQNSGWIGMRNKLRRGISHLACPVDRIMGYPTHRGWDLARGLTERPVTFRPMS